MNYLDNVRLISTPTKSYSSSPQILDGLDRTGSQFKEGLHVLWELCDLWMILPATYLVPGKLSISTARIDKSGVYGEIYKGSLGDADVCIRKSPRYYLGRIRQVSCHRSIWLDCHALTSFEGTSRGGCDTEVPQSPKYCVLQGCHPQPPSTRVGMDTSQRIGRIYRGKLRCRLNQPRESIPSHL